MPHHPQSPKKQSPSKKKPAPKKPATKKPTVVPPKPAPKPIPQKPLPQKPKPIEKKPVVEPPKIQPAATRGTISWTLTPEAEVCARRQDIVDGISRAVDTYNTYASFSQSVTVHYDPSVETAHANGNTITYGNMFGYRVSLHELGHAVGGVGTRSEWTTNQTNGVWTGPHASTLIKELDGPDAVIHCDQLHFWGPFSGGLNYDSELTPGADIRHVALVKALVDDMNSI